MESKDNLTSKYSPVCMIYSELSLKELEEVLKHYSTETSGYGPLRIMRNKDLLGEWRDTNRTIVVVSETLFETLTQKGFDKPFRTPDRPSIDFRIVPYEVRHNNLPKEGQKKDLFIRIPASVQLSSQEVNQIIKDKIDSLLSFNLLGPDDYEIKIPLKNKDRVTNLVRNSCFLTFSPNVTERNAALIKAVIDDTFWGDHPETFNCFWALDHRPTSKMDQSKSKVLLKKEILKQSPSGEEKQ